MFPPAFLDLHFFFCKSNHGLGRILHQTFWGLDRNVHCSDSVIFSAFYGSLSLPVLPSLFKHQFLLSQGSACKNAQEIYVKWFCIKMYHANVDHVAKIRGIHEATILLHFGGMFTVNNIHRLFYWIFKYPQSCWLPNVFMLQKKVKAVLMLLQVLLRVQDELWNRSSPLS